jgi:2,3-bisphosphoglycerate-independent phosphoglycerate mutase
MMSEIQKPFVLLFLDGLGIAPVSENNAVASSATPFLDSAMQSFPCGLLSASAESIGLERGNSGTGASQYLTLGAGRVLPWGETRVSRAIADGSFKQQFQQVKQLQQVKQSQGTLHLVGCISASEEHAKEAHLRAIADEASRMGISNIILHSIVHDDSSSFQLATHNSQPTTLQISSHLAEDAALHTDRSLSARDAILKEMSVSERDAIIFFNFDYTSLRQLVESFKNRVSSTLLITLTDYGIEGVEALFPLTKVSNPLSAVLGEANVPHLKIFDPIKFPLLTHYFNGKNEEPFPGEEWMRVEDEASAFKKIITEVAAGPKIIFASVSSLSEAAKTGDREKASEALHRIDGSVNELSGVVARYNGTLLITSAYGHAEAMGSALSENPVPFIAVSKEWEGRNLWGSVPQQSVHDWSQLPRIGNLSDVAPTILKLLGILPPPEMTGKPLL